MREKKLIGNEEAIWFTSFRVFIYLFIFFFFLYFYATWLTQVDLQLHVRIIEKLDHGQLAAPHFLYHFIVYVISKISNTSFHFASCVTMAASIVFSTIVIEQIVRHFLKDRYSNYFLLFVAVALASVSSIYFPFVNKWPYLGTFSPNPWHNPTFIAAKPFMLLSFYLYSLEITKEKCFGERFSLLRIAYLLAICALIKPSFILAFIPTSILFCLFMSGKRIFMLLKTIQLLLPVLAVLVFQFLFTYYYDVGGSSSIQFGFFEVWQAYAKSIPLAIIQAVTFPLVVSAVLFKHIPKDKPLLSSWILFTVGLFFWSFLSESGGRKYDGNFAWTYMSCLNILFVYSTTSFLKWLANAENKTRAFRLIISFCTVVFLLHLFSGIYYVIYLISGNAL